MRELQDEVGPEWVHCLKEGLSSASLLDAVNELRSHDRPELPRFQNRDWLIVAAQYAELYKQLLFGHVEWQSRGMLMLLRELHEPCCQMN